jgi:SAM-dependent methyltransferase
MRRQYADGSTLDARSSIYEWQSPRHDLVAEVARLVDPTLGPVVDVGCGRGQHLRGLAALGVPAVGLDLSPGLASAAAGASGRPTVIGDATALPLADATVGTALALHMLYHLPDPAVGLHELCRVTRLGGRVVVLTNGRDHLGTYRDLVREATGLGESLAWPGSAFSLDHRPLVESILGPVEVVELRATVTLSAAAPLIAYFSSARELYETQGSLPWAEVAARFEAIVDRRLAQHGTVTLPTHSGIFVARR